MTNAAIVASMKTFVAATHSDGSRKLSHQRAVNLIISTASFRRPLTKAAIGRALDINHKSGALVTATSSSLRATREGDVEIEGEEEENNEPGDDVIEGGIYLELLFT